jgi:endonuclease YncB( thermonuclease family)
MFEIVIAAGLVFAVDGDGLMINGIEHRLIGIDAPEKRQQCFIKNASVPLKTYPCGAVVSLKLNRLIARSKQIRCRWDQVERFGRPLSMCERLQNGKWININRELVSGGAVVAFRKYDRRFVAEADAAKSARRFLWSMTFTRPTLWRSNERKAKKACRARFNGQGWWFYVAGNVTGSTIGCRPKKPRPSNKRNPYSP